MLLDFGLRILKGDISTDGQWCFIIFRVCLSSGAAQGPPLGCRCGWLQVAPAAAAAAAQLLLWSLLLPWSPDRVWADVSAAAAAHRVLLTRSRPAAPPARRRAAALAAAQGAAGGHLPLRHRLAAAAVALAVGAQGAAALPAAGAQQRRPGSGLLFPSRLAGGGWSRRPVSRAVYMLVAAPGRPRLHCRWPATTGRACCTRCRTRCGRATQR